ncbi:MAG: hypothetical protein J6X72_03550, partial [Clostridia bacterium]|nr:hypothetical protein [Clostridia bacterium]
MRVEKREETEGKRAMLIVGIAGLVIGIEHRYPYLAKHCTAYQTDGTPDFTVTVTDKMIEDELARAETIPEGVTPGYLESLAVARAIAHWLPGYDAFLFHAAVIEYKGEAIAFTAPSGTGKSTHIKNWTRAFGADVDIVNGDKPILRFGSDGTLTAYWTPWAGKEGWSRNVGRPLKAVVFLERGKEDRVVPLSPADAALPVMNQILLESDPETVAETLALADR